jgi:hypothetical protein
MRFGVEIEFHLPSGHASEPAEALRQRLPHGWGLAQELRAGLEATSTIYTSLESFCVDVSRACASIKAARGIVKPHDYVDALHVHMDAKELGAERASRLTHAYYDQLARFNRRWMPLTGRTWRPPPHGVDTYCSVDTMRRLIANDLGDGKSPVLMTKYIEGWDRRPALNLHAYYGTLEARQHPGTLCPKAIVSWIVELYGLANVPPARPSRALQSTRMTFKQAATA